MELFISLSVRTSPLADAKVSLENSKDALDGAKRRAAVARKKLTEKQSAGETNLTSARKEVKEKQASVATQQDIVRVNEQRVGRASVVDRLVTEWNRLEKLKGTQQDTDQNKARRSSLAKQITEARRALRAIKRPKSTVKKPKKPRRY